VELVWKISECQRLMGDFLGQKTSLESIPGMHRTLKVSVALGKLYRRFGGDTFAIACFQDALATSPFAVEAIEPLAQMGVKEHDIVCHMAGQAHVMPWLTQYVSAVVLQAANDHKAGQQTFHALAQSFPESTEALSGLAVCHMEIGNHEEAAQAFAQLRDVDEYCVDHMDKYAQVLKAKGDGGKLNKLTHSLLEIDVRRPESWVAGSLYMELKDDGERALEYADKALQLDPRHAEAHIRKGLLHLDRNLYEPALMCFRTALEVRWGVRAYQGAVRAYIGLDRVKEALTSAKESLQRMPRNAKALSLVGQALSQLPECMDKAKVAFDKARQLNPLCSDTVMAQVDVLLQQERLEESADCLEAFLRLRDRDFIHSRLGDIYVKTHKYEGALNEYHMALAMNPGLESAKIGLERLEKVMRGMDPDGDGEGGEDEDDEVDSFGNASYQD